MSDTPVAVPPPTNRRAVGDILVQVVGKLGNGVLGIAVIFLVVRILGQEDFGRWTTLLTIISIAAPLTDVGITQVAIGRAASHPEEEPSWLGALLMVRLGLAVITTLLCVGAVLLLADQGAMRAAGVLLSLTVLLSGISALAAVFQLHLRNDRLVVVITVNSILWTVAVVLVYAVFGGGLVVLAACFLGAAILSVALQTALALRGTRLAFEGWRERGRELLRVGLPLSITTVLITAYVKTDQLLVFSIAGDGAAGLYGAAYRILDQALIIPAAVATTLYPLLVRAHRADPERMRFLLQRAFEMLAAVGLGALAFAIPVGGDVLGLLFGSEFAAAGPTLAVLMAVFLLSSMGYLNGILVLIFGLQKRGMVYAAVGLVVNLGLNLALIPSYGYVAAAWATLVTELVVILLTGRVTLHALGWRPETTVVVRTLAAAALTGLTLATLQGLGLPLGVLMVLAPLLYGGLLITLGGLRVRETLALVRPGGRA